MGNCPGGRPGGGGGGDGEGERGRGPQGADRRRGEEGGGAGPQGADRRGRGGGRGGMKLTFGEHSSQVRDEIDLRGALEPGREAGMGPGGKGAGREGVGGGRGGEGAEERMPCFVRRAPTGRHANAPPPRGMRGSCQTCQHGGGEGVVAAAWLLRLGTGCRAVNHAAGLEEGGSSALSGLATLRLPRSPGSPVPVRAGLAKRARTLGRRGVGGGGKRGGGE